MPSYLLCAPPIYGHLAPLIEIGRGLVARGASVTLLTGTKYRAQVEDAGLTFAPLPPEVDYDDSRLDDWLPGREQVKGLASIPFALIGMFVRVVPGQYRALLRLLEQHPFDAVIGESAFTGLGPYMDRPAVERLPVFGVSTTPVILTSVDAAPFGSALPPATGPMSRLRNRALNAFFQYGVLRPVRRASRAVAAEIGVPPSDVSTFDFAYRLFDRLFQLSIPELEYPRRELPDSVRFVGPLRPAVAPMTVLPEWWEDLSSGRPVVHVTQGTIDNTDLTRLIAPTITALAEEDVLVVATTGNRPVEEIREALGGPLPDNVRVASFISHDELLPLCDAFVSNGGFGGVQRALSHGVPLVVAGSTEDKPEVAARVSWAGVGLDLRTGTPDAAAIRAAVHRVLTEPGHRDRSRRMQEIMAAAPDPVDVIWSELAAVTRVAP
jgi:MGT family glycosyltransferase